MKVVDIADDVFRELGNPSTISIPAIAFYIRGSVGGLNNYINTTFELNSSLEIEETVTDNSTGTETTTEIGIAEVAILKKMYLVHFYDSKIRTNLTTLDTDTIVEVTDQGSSVRKINKNEISKTLLSIRNQEYEGLQKLIAQYKISKSTPNQVAGDDTTEGFYTRGEDFNRSAM
tara:strand:+ start:1159 stop:1680 length:522 start_codon:yes stop_codon:yes gene_type:complete